jgi:hypothetical protein
VHARAHVNRSLTASTMESRYYSAPSSAAGSPASSPGGLPEPTPTPGSFFALPRAASPGSATSPGSTGELAVPRRAPPSPGRAGARLSFISYADLVGSVPAVDTPLSALTAGASAAEPPPHLAALGAEHGAHGSARNSMLLGGGRDDAGREWEREGMGGGLEERLEALMRAPVAGTV